MALRPPTSPGSPARAAARAWLALATGCLAAASPPLTLVEAQRIALERNADVRIAGTQVAAAIAQLRVVREYPNPVLGLSTSKISTDGVTEATPLGNGLLSRSYDSVVSLGQLIVLGKRGLQRDAAKAGVSSAQFQRDDARRLLIEAVTQAYAGALAALKEAEVLADSAAKLRHEADIAAHRYKAGDLSESDQAQLDIAADQDELSADAERAAAKTGVVALEILLGDPAPSGETALADTLERWMQGIDPDLEEAPIGSRPDIAAAEASVRQADAVVSLQRRQRIPDLTASVQYERNPPAQPDTVGVGISLPLPLWDHFDGEILAAKAAREQTQAQLDKVRIQAAADVAAARVAYHEASRRARRYQVALVPKSSSVARSVSYSYEKGGATLVDLLEAERNDNLIRIAAVQSQADAASAAVTLEAALGRLEGPENQAQADPRAP